MKNIYKQIARIHGVSAEEIEQEIAHALSLAKQSSSQQAHVFWTNAEREKALSDEYIIVFLAKTCEKH